MNSKWFVCLLECCDGSFYTGITNNIEKRMKSHKLGIGSKYIRAKGFKKLLYFKELENHSEALITELEIKKLDKKSKVDWFKEKLRFR